MIDINSRLDKIVQSAVGATGPGAILGVTAPLQGITWHGAAGLFERSENQPLKPTDGFRIASMSKTFTAVLVMMLVEEGKLSLSDNLTRFFDKTFVSNIHPEGLSITLHHLLNHTAGLWDFALSKEWMEEITKDPSRFRAPQEILEWATSHGEPACKLGEKHVYSDTGYVLLGRILELLTGSTYAELCRTRIFDPLEMNETWLEGHEDPSCSLSHCYAGDIDAMQINGSLDWAAGGHVSTLGDLDKFLRGFFHTPSLVLPQTIDKMLVPVATPSHQYGFGIGIRREQAPEKP